MTENTNENDDVPAVETFKNQSVFLYADGKTKVDGSPNSPTSLSPDEARRVAHRLLRAAAELEGDGDGERAPECLFRVPTTTNDDVQEVDGLTLADMRDLRGLSLYDVPTGPTSTGFVFERDDGSLTGFQVPLPQEGIVPKDFELKSEDDMQDIEID